MSRASEAERDVDGLLSGSGGGGQARDLNEDRLMSCISQSSACATPALVITILYCIGWLIGEIWALVLYTNHRNDLCKQQMAVWLGVAGGTGLFASFVSLCLWSSVVASLGPKANGEIGVSQTGGASYGCLMAAFVFYIVTTLFGVSWLIYGSAMVYGSSADKSCAVYSFMWHYALLWYVFGAAYGIALLIAYGTCKK